MRKTVRPEKRTKFTVVERDLVNDKRLSFKARGLLVWLLDKPDDWEADTESIAEQATDGRDAVRAGLRELEALGYIHRERIRAERGRWDVILTVYERPPQRLTATENPSPSNNPQVVDEQVENSITATENPSPSRPLTGTENPSPSERFTGTDCPAPENPSIKERILNKPNTKTEKPSPPSADDKRQPNPIWDALVEVMWNPQTRQEKSRFGKTVREIRGAFPDGTPEDRIASEVRKRSAIYRQRWPNAELTPEALVKHWGMFDPAGPHHTPVSSPNRKLSRQEEIEAHNAAVIREVSERLRASRGGSDR